MNRGPMYTRHHQSLHCTTTPLKLGHSDSTQGNLKRFAIADDGCLQPSAEPAIPVLVFVKQFFSECAAAGYQLPLHLCHIEFFADRATSLAQVQDAPFAVLTDQAPHTPAPRKRRADAPLALTDAPAPLAAEEDPLAQELADLMAAYGYGDGEAGREGLVKQGEAKLGNHFVCVIISHSRINTRSA